MSGGKGQTQRERERERERENENLKQAPGSEPAAGLELKECEIMT